MYRTYYYYTLLILVLVAWSHTTKAQFAKPYEFVENQQQWQPDVRFRAKLPGGFLHLHPHQLTYTFYDAHAVEEMHHAHHQEGAAHQRVASALPTVPTSHKKIKAHGIQVAFLGANPGVKLIGNSIKSVRQNYFLGNDPARWSSNLAVYEGATYQNVYPKTDLHFIQQNGQLKYEFVLAVGADPSAIRLQYEGAESMYLHEGNLHVETTLNTLIEQRPFSYQLIEGDTVVVPSHFQLRGNTVSFEFPEGYHKAYPLVIDPILIFARYSGSFSDNWGNSATYDAAGNSYVSGITFGADFPVTGGAFDVSYAGQVDVVIMKYDSLGTNVQYATFLGGLEEELPASMIVNSRNELVVMGITGSSNFPIPLNGFDRVFGGGRLMYPFPTPDGSGGVTAGSPQFVNGTDIFISIFNENGSALVGGTYLGGSENDGVTGGRAEPTFEISPLMRNYGDSFRGEIVLDAQDNIYVASATESADFPISGNAYDTSLGGLRDALVVKLNPNASSLLWATYLGGSERDAAYGIRVNTLNEVYVTGGTASTDFPTSVGALNLTYQGGSTDGFISRLSSDGTALRSSTFLGTTRYDQGYLLDLDDQGNVAVFGQTLGSYLVTPNVFSVANSSQFIHKLDSELRTTIFSTRIGNGVNEINLVPTAFTITNCNTIYFAGWGGGSAGNGGFNTIGGSVSGMPTTPNALQRFTDGADFYLGILSANGSTLEYGSFIGAFGARGDHVDGGTSRFDPKGVVYQAVCSCQPDVFEFPSTVNVNNSSNCNMLVFKMDLSTLNADFEPSVSEGCVPLDVTFRNQSEGGLTFTWDTGDGTTLSGAENPQHTYTEAGEYVVTLTISDPNSCQKFDVHTDTIQVFPREFSITPDTTICRGDSLQLSVSGGVSYRWREGRIPDAANPTPIVAPQENTTYSVIAINEFGCRDTLSVTVEIREPVNVDFEANFVDRCAEPGRIQLVNRSTGIETFRWDVAGIGSFENQDTVEVNFTESGNFIIQLETQDANRDTCIVQTVAVDTVSIFYPSYEITPDTTLCEGETITLRASGGVSYEWLNDAFENPTAATQTFSVLSSETYSVAVTDSVGCPDTLQVTVTMNPIIEVDFVYEFVDRCENPGLVRFINQSRGTQDFVWDLGGLATIENQDTLTFNFEEDGLYHISLAAKEENLCNGDTLFTQTVPIIYPAFRITPDTFLCLGETLPILAEGGITYQWLEETFVNNTLPSQSVSPTATTTYTVVATDSIGCTDTLQTQITVVEPLEARFTHQFVDRCASPGLVQFINQSTGTDSIVWSIGDTRIELRDTVLFNFEANGTYSIQLEALDAEGYPCLISPLATDTLDIIIPEYQISADTTLCEGDSIQLSVSGGVQYRWLNTSTLSETNIATPVATPSATTTYSVEITNVLGCIDTLSTTLRVLPIIEVDFSYMLLDRCANPNIVEFVNQSKGTQSFRWEVEGIASIENEDTVQIAFTEAGTYVVSLQALDSNACSQKVFKQDTLTLDFPTFVSTTDTTVCRGETIFLNASGGTAYQWLQEGNVVGTSSVLPVQIDSTQTYQVRFTNNEGCSELRNIEVTTFPEIAPSFQFVYEEQCVAPFRIRFENTGKGYEQFTWLINGEEVSNSQDTLRFSFAEEGDYTITLRVEAENPCNYSLEYRELIPINFTNIVVSEDTTICFGESVTLQAQGLETFVWQPSNSLSNSTIANPIASPTSTTTYTLTTANADCSFTEEVTISVVPEIDLSFGYTLEPSCGELPTVRFTNTSEGAAAYFWEFGDGVTTTNEGPTTTHRYTNEGTFTITLLGVNENCQERIEQPITVAPFLPPNAFSPNGDMYNEVFDLGEQGKGVRLEIFNRWGERVYQADNYQNTWDGGNLAEGVYFYQITPQEGSTCRGWVKLLR